MITKAKNELWQKACERTNNCIGITKQQKPGEPLKV